MYLSEILALAAATCIATSGMLVSEVKGRIDIFRLARWQMVASFLMTAGASLVVGGWHTLEPWQLGYLGASSLFGIVIATTTYFAAIYTAGARTTALLFSLASPFALLLGYIVLGETIDMQQGLGVILVLFGIVLAIGLPASKTPAKTTATAPVPWLGIGLGVITAIGQALGSLCARPAMAAGVEPFTARAVRSGIAAIVFLLASLLPLAALRNKTPVGWDVRFLALGSAFFGTGLGMSLLMAALSNGNVGIVSTLSSMTPVLILPMVWVRTGIAPPKAAWFGAALAVCGTALISL
ncbi:drug/metabolite transporter (DMT)-like permease [Pararhizobium capsulatum DSM 1112]|uniref:Drug/metabolite transporter (DMT)-like permease n=1 Tax=Pararhizobium capsulatum DSM 1112 TaxID=1121113 RepID=A0ABU0BTN9_9HYPH|nr:DMT family transporter [Pararhizobium capsulatum]MDQ0321323.1 drug/metabolite transporter (DMT)-like permease [Pararhizobium capsulatum DSM 1112]